MKKSTLTATLMTATLAMAGCGNAGKPPQAEEILRPVRTVVVDTQGAITSREFAGVVDADQKLDLAFRVSGTLQELPVLEGDRVEKGQLVAALDRTEFNIQLRAVSADFERARAEFSRMSELMERQLIARADHERAQAQYAAALAELERSKQDLAHASLHSPFAGYIARRHVENHSEVSARSPVLTLMDLDSLVVRIEVPESIMIVAQREGARPEMYAVFDGRESVQYPLAIKEIGARPDSGTSTYPVSLSLPEITDLNVLPGMSVMVRVRPVARFGDVASVIYLPSQAVLEDAAGRFVLVAVPTDDGVALIERRNVTVGDVSSFGIQVLSGLGDGEQVVTAGMSQIKPGQRVRLPAA